MVVWKSIQLSNGGSVIVDESDYEELSRYTWTKLTRPRGKTSYAVRSVSTESGRRLRLMHREVIGAISGQEVDHINGNGLDNRRANLRLATSSQNKASRKKRPSKSGFRGVHRNPETGRFQTIMSLGTYETAEQAAAVYDEFAALLWGEFARVNFPALDREHD